MIIAAINPTIPASPKDCTKLIMFPAISPTNGTFPPIVIDLQRYLTQVMKLLLLLSCQTLKLILRLLSCYPPSFLLIKNQKRIMFVLNYELLSFLTVFDVIVEPANTTKGII